MYQLKPTYKTIKEVVDNTRFDVLPNVIQEGKQNVQMYLLGHYSPSNANWSYDVGVATIEGKLYMIVKVFGGVKGAVRLWHASNDN